MDMRLWIMSHAENLSAQHWLAVWIQVSATGSRERSDGPVLGFRMSTRAYRPEPKLRALMRTWNSMQGKGYAEKYSLNSSRCTGRQGRWRCVIRVGKWQIPRRMGDHLRTRSGTSGRDRQTSASRNRRYRRRTGGSAATGRRRHRNLRPTLCRDTTYTHSCLELFAGRGDCQIGYPAWRTGFSIEGTSGRLRLAENPWRRD